MASVAILGGGISGLTAAYFLKKEGISFTLFEASNAVGGKIRSITADGYIIEHGPNSLQTTTPLLNQIIEETGLTQHQIFGADKAKKRFIVKQGAPRALPMSLPALLKSNFFSFKSKLGLLKEPLISRAVNDVEESVAHFVKRRLGQEFLDYVFDPFVTGIFAGNPETLSLQHAFPSLFQLEQEHGSLLRGVLANKKKKHASPEKKATVKRIFSFTHGMQMLPFAVADTFQEWIQLSTKVIDIVPEENRWRIQVQTNEIVESHVFDAVLCTIPLPAFQACGQSLQATLNPLWQVSYPPVTVLALGFHREDVTHPLDGFGMLVPGKEADIRILGTIFSSSIFPNRAPTDHVLLTSLVGGARKADFCKLPEDLLQDFVLDDLHQLLGVNGDPTFAHQLAVTHAIPQYDLGYDQVKKGINDLEARHKGLFFAGNYRNGISVGDSVHSGYEASQNLTRHFG